MKYLFVAGTTFDMAGLAMIKGAIKGIVAFDPRAKFGTCFPEKHIGTECSFLNFNPSKKMEEGYQWADAILDVGGILQGPKARSAYVDMARKNGKLYVWMGVSFMKDVNPETLRGTLMLSRGKRSYGNVRRLNAGKPINVPDMSFLLEPEMDSVDDPLIKNTVFTTHHNKPWRGMFTVYNEMKSNSSEVQQVQWKTKRGKVWEPLIDEEDGVFQGTPEQNFGKIQQANNVHTARYHTAVGAVMAGMKKNDISLYVHTLEKYNDLLDYCGKELEMIRAKVLVACGIVVTCTERGDSQWI